jgi:transposase
MGVAMIDRRLVFEIHRMADDGLSGRKIARALQLDRTTVGKYLVDPHPVRTVVIKASKLDPFKDLIQALLDRDRDVSATVIHQRLQAHGFDGGLTILRAYLRKIRPKPKEAFIRFESQPGEQFQLDWGHFGSLAYGNTSRKLYALAVIECHSRLLTLEFTHSQRQETLHRALLNALQFFGGCPRELVHDNMLTAVIERDGPLVRFNEAFLDFLRPFHMVPLPCNVGQAHEKGKIEKGAIHYIRHNFWPLRSFRDLDDLKSQANQWRDEVANQRVHATTGERPIDRFRPQSLKPLPELLPDCRDTAPAKVHPDFSIHFDGNTYTVPPWLIGRTVIAKADPKILTVYFKDKAVATHQRTFERHRRIELPHHVEEARRRRNHRWLSEDAAILMSLGEDAKVYVEHLAETGGPLRKNVTRLLALKEDYGSEALLHAVRRALAHRAFGADYIENILYQDMTPTRLHPPVRIENHEALNRIRLQEPSLADYDTFVATRRNHHDD